MLKLRIPNQSAFRAVFLCAFFLVHCSKKPELPRLPAPDTQKFTQRLALDDSLDVADWKELFRAINRKGELDGLKPYVEDPPASQLREIAQIASRYIYELSDKDGEFVDLLNARAKSIEPQKLLADVRGITSEATYRGFARAMLDAAANPLLPELMSRSSGFLDEKLWRQVRYARDEVRRTHPYAGLPYPSWLPGIFRDVGRLLSQKEIQKDFVDVLTQLQKNDLIGPVIQATHQLRTEDPFALRDAAQGITRLAEMSRPEGDGSASGLDLLFKFAHEADGPTNGLFDTLGSNLPDLIQTFAPAAQQELPKAIARSLEHYLANGFPGRAGLSQSQWLGLTSPVATTRKTSLLEFFTAARTAAQSLSAPCTPNVRLDLDDNCRNIYLTAYALVRVLTQSVALNAPEWSRPDRAAWFPKAVWSKGAVAKPIQIGVTDKDGNLDPELSHDFELVGLEKRAAQILRSLANAHHPVALQIPLSDGARLSEQLVEAALGLDAKLSVARIEATSGLLADKLGKKGDEEISGLGFLETKNLLDLFHVHLMAFDREDWKTFEQLVFVDWSLGDLRADTKRDILGLYRNDEDGAKRVAKLLDALPMIHEASVPAVGKYSLFDLYHRVVCNIAKTGLRGFGSALSFLGKHSFFASTDPKTPGAEKYAGFFGIARDTEGLRFGLELLSWLPIDDARFSLVEKFRTALRSSGDSDGVKTYVDFASSWLTEHSEEIARWLESPRTFGGLTDAEMNWLRRFIDSGDHVLLWNFFLQHGSVDKALALTRTLKNLALSGYLGEAIDALSRFRNRRLQHLSARLQEWNRSGALLSWFEALEAALQPL